MRGADILVQTLAAAGVTRIFSLSGNQIMPVYDACVTAGIEIVHVRHEAAAVFMADAHAQLTGGLGVCLLTAAPGVANGLGPLFTARCSESPVLLLSGDSPQATDGRGAFQELEQVPMTAPLTKLSFRATSAACLGQDITDAIRVAQSGRPGPVHIALPFDVLQDDAGAAEVPASHAPDAAAPDATEIGSVLKLLADAARPVVLCGPLLSRTRGGDPDALAEALDAPVVVMESPRGLNDPALGELRSVLRQSDLVLCLGKTVDFTVGFGNADSFGDGCRWIVVDPDRAERDRARRNLGDRLALLCTGDAHATVGAFLLHRSDAAKRRPWIDKVAGLVAARAERDPVSSSGQITSRDLCDAVQTAISARADTVVCCDGGEFGQWAQAFTRGARRLVNGPSGAIGGALCYAIAASKAQPTATVFALMGDGTVGFHFSEFETALRENAPFIAIVGNDRRWNAEHQIQLRDYGPSRLIGCELSGARYDLAVTAFGGHGEYVTEAADLAAALDRAIESGKPALVNVEIDGQPAPLATS